MAHRATVGRMPSRLAQSSASVAVSAAFALVPIGRAPAGVRRGLGAAFAVVPAVAVGAMLHARMRGRSDARRAATALGAGAVVAAASAGSWELSVRADRAIERMLVRRGVQRPRATMAVGAGVLTAAIDALDVVAQRRARVR